MAGFLSLGAGPVDGAASTRRCELNSRERFEVRGASLVVIRKSVPDAADGEVSRRWVVCDRRSGRRSVLGAFTDEDFSFSGRLERFTVRGRVVAWTDTRAGRTGPGTTHVRVRRFGQRTSTFSSPYGPTGGVPTDGIRTLRLSTNGTLAFVARKRFYGDTLWVLGADRITRRVDAARYLTLSSLRWRTPTDLTWRYDDGLRDVTVPTEKDPCLAVLRSISDATLTSVRGLHRDRDDGAACLREAGQAVDLPGSPVSIYSQFSVGLAGPFAVRWERDLGVSAGAATVIDLRTGQPAGIPQRYVGDSPFFALGPDGRLRINQEAQ